MIVVQGIILGCIAGLFFLESRIGGQHMLDRPILIGPVVGLVMGDLTTGLIVGGSLELIWMGLMGIGTATPPDVVTGAVLATALTIQSGLPIETALALAIPIATLAQIVNIGVTTVNTVFCHMADRFAEKGDHKGVTRTVWFGAALYFTSKFLMSCIGFIVGAEVIGIMVEHLPTILIDGLRVATAMLPALGVGMLLQMTYSKKFAPFLFLGFGLVAFMGTSTVGVSIFGAIAAMVYYQLSGNKEVI